jgi:hypothetical protein
VKMKVRHSVQIVSYAVCLILFGSLGYASPSNAGQITADKKSTVKGTIKSRSGELINVKDSKTGTVVVVSLSESTKIIRKKGAFKFRGSAMDVTAMVPGLGIEAEGVGNAKGQLAASKVTFSPDDFAIEVAEEQQIMANKAAAANA